MKTFYCPLSPKATFTLNGSSYKAAGHKFPTDDKKIIEFLEKNPNWVDEEAWKKLQLRKSGRISNTATAADKAVKAELAEAKKKLAEAEKALAEAKAKTQ